jgi:hypothetical protein
MTDAFCCRPGTAFGLARSCAARRARAAPTQRTRDRRDPRARVPDHPISNGSRTRSRTHDPSVPFRAYRTQSHNVHQRATLTSCRSAALRASDMPSSAYRSTGPALRPATGRSLAVGTLSEVDRRRGSNEITESRRASADGCRARFGRGRDVVLNVLWGSQQRSCMSARSVQIDVLAGSDALAHRHSRIVGALSCNPQVDHERVQRPHPQVVGLPPPDLAKQVGIDGSDHRRSPDRVSLVRCRTSCVRPALGEVARG